MDLHPKDSDQADVQAYEECIHQQSGIRVKYSQRLLLSTPIEGIEFVREFLPCDADGTKTYIVVEREVVVKDLDGNDFVAINFGIRIRDSDDVSIESLVRTFIREGSHPFDSPI